MILDRIQIDPNVCGGKPSIRGLRITVDFVLKLLADLHISPRTVQFLQRLGREVIRVNEILPATAPDPAIVAIILSSPVLYHHLTVHRNS